MRPTSASLIRCCVATTFAIVGVAACDSTGPDTSRVVASVVVTPDTRTFTALNDSARLAAEAKNSEGSNISGVTFAWSSLENSIVSVDHTGMVKARAVGTARIVVSASGKADTATITVTQTAAHVILTPAADTINAIGDVVSLTAVVTDANDIPLTNPTITWSTPTPAVVTAVGGNVTSLATGSGVVIATSGAVADTAAVLSRQIAATLTVAPTSVTVLQGETQSLTATAADSNGVALPASAITWTSATQSIATVSSAGVVRGESGGGTTITASAPGRSIDVPVTVYPGAASGPLTWSVVHKGWALDAVDALGVSGRSANDVYAVTPTGNGVRYDGSRWTEALGSLQVPFSRLRSFWVSPSSSSIWAVGTQSRPNLDPPPVTRIGHVFRSMGGAWTTEHVGPDGTEYWDVSGTSDSDVWVSGTHILHYDGAIWTIAHGSPASGFVYTSIWTAGGTSMFAGTNSGAIRRYQGGVWVEAQSAPDNSFPVTDIWGTSANDVWAVDEGGFVRHWNGVAWEPSTRFAGVLRAVWGTSPTNVWVAGNNILAHWNGAIWFSADPATTAIGEVRGGWQSSATSGWFVTAQGMLSELRPEGWTTHWDSPGLFTDVAGFASDVWICGHRGSIQHLSGGTWRTERLPRSDACGSVTPRSTTDVLAGGVTLIFGAPSIYYRFNGSTWTVNAAGTTKSFEDMWTTPGGQSYAVDGTATVYRFDGAGWVAMATGSPQRLHSIWASGPNDVYAAGEVGTVMRYDGASWTQLATGTTGRLEAVWGASSANVFFVGSDPNGGLVLRYDGTTFSASNPTSRGLNGVHGRSPNEVYAVGAGGTLIRFNGNAWSAEASGVDRDLYDVWALERGEVYAVGVPSLIVRGVR